VQFIHTSSFFFVDIPSTDNASRFLDSAEIGREICYYEIMTETKWLTIADASLLAAEMGLDRTHKTIRSWCRKGDLIAEKQSTRTGDRWVADRDSLITKINFELEFKEQQSEPVRTSSDQSGHVQTSANAFDGQNIGFQAGANLGEPQAF